MQPCETTALMSAHEECWPFKTTAFFCLENQLKESRTSQ